MPEQRIKKYVEVIADFLPDGTLTPQTVVWDTGQRFDITNKGGAKSVSLGIEIHGMMFTDPSRIASLMQEI